MLDKPRIARYKVGNMTKQHCPRRLMGEHHELHLPCDIEEITRQRRAAACPDCVAAGDWWCEPHYREMMDRIGQRQTNPDPTASKE